MFNQHIKVSRRYAKALLSLAKENDVLEETYNDMKLVYQVFSASKELQVLMRSPVIRIGKKQRIVRSLFEHKVNGWLFGYMMIIIRKQRASLLLGIARAFLVVYKESLGIELVKVTTAIPMTDELRKKSMEVAQKLTELKIEFHEHVDEKIIGGFIIKLGDRQYDASIRGKLGMMRKHLENYL
jgi:F-type H+-transporting ATPase subunit delta